MQNKKLFLWAAALVCAAALAGCSQNDKKNDSVSFQKMPITDKTDNGSSPKDSSDNNSGNASEDFSDNSDDNDADSLISRSDIQGHVVEFSETGCILSPVKSKKVDGGMLAQGAAPGNENEKDNINIHYSSDCQFQLAKINITTGKADVSDADISSIKKQTNLIVYGKWKDEHNIEATKVVITRYE